MSEAYLMRYNNSSAECPFPVGFVFQSQSDISPASMFANTTWERIEDRMLIGASDTYPPGSTGGNAEITQTLEQMPKHQHNSAKTQGPNITQGMTLGSAYQNDILINYAYVENGSRWTAKGTNMMGGSQPMNILNPYLAVYMWVRVS